MNLGRHHRGYGRSGQEKNTLTLPEFEPRTVQPIAWSLYWPPYTGSTRKWMKKLCAKNG